MQKVEKKKENKEWNLIKKEIALKEEKKSWWASLLFVFVHERGQSVNLCLWDEVDYFLTYFVVPGNSKVEVSIEPAKCYGILGMRQEQGVRDLLSCQTNVRIL